MIIVGLTGSIGMGKTEAAKTFRRFGVPVFDADSVVHQLMGRDGDAVAEVAASFPDVVRDGVVDRQALGAAVFDKPKKLKQLESILHPRVRQAETRFLAAAARRRELITVLDIPLLFESGHEDRCDVTAVVSAPEFVQRGRVLRRPGMTRSKFAAILARQMPDPEKRQRADFVILTGLGKRFSLHRIRDLITMLRNVPTSNPSPVLRRRRLYA